MFGVEKYRDCFVVLDLRSLASPHVAHGDGIQILESLGTGCSISMAQRKNLTIDSDIAARSDRTLPNRREVPRSAHPAATPFNKDEIIEQLSMTL